MKDSARTWLNWVAVKKYIVRWTNWRTKTTRTTSLQKKFVCTETIGGFVRTQLVPIRCQFGTDLTSSKHCQPCDISNTKKIQLISKDGKALPHLGGTGKESWWHSSSEHHRDAGPDTDWSGKPDGQWLGQLFEVWFSELIWCRITVQNSVTANSSSLSPTGRCKHKTSNTAKFYEKWLRRKQKLQWKLWEQVCDELQHHKQQLEQHAQQAAHNAQQHIMHWART